MSDNAALDAFAQIAVSDLFGDTPEGKAAHQQYQQTGRLPGKHMNEGAPRQRQGDDSPGVVVVKPLDYRELTKKVSESQVVEALMNDGYKEKAGAIDQVANTACVYEAFLKKFKK